jgi:hypothetical protein
LYLLSGKPARGACKKEKVLCLCVQATLPLCDDKHCFTSNMPLVVQVMPGINMHLAMVPYLKKTFQQTRQVPRTTQTEVDRSYCNCISGKLLSRLINARHLHSRP